LAAAPPAAPVTLSDRRVALVIGNSDYRTVAALPARRRDAEAVADALRQDGFQTVMLMSDLTRDAMRDALRAFRAVADDADWAVVYFAGHGLEAGGAGRLVPIDAGLADENAAADETIAYADVEQVVGGARALRLIIIDADRNNPFAAQGAAPRAPSAGSGAPDTASEMKSGVLMVFSTRGGDAVIEAGDGGVSPFARALAAQLKAPGVEIRRLFAAVRDDVLRATGGRQRLFAYGALPGHMEFYFVAGK
jgi:uncharacterized caspase-like protein